MEPAVRDGGRSGWVITIITADTKLPSPPRAYHILRNPKRFSLVQGF